MKKMLPKTERTIRKIGRYLQSILKDLPVKHANKLRKDVTELANFRSPKTKPLKTKSRK